MRSSRGGLNIAELWMRTSRVVRASDRQCRSCKSPQFDQSILPLWVPHSEIWAATDEAVLNKVSYIKLWKQLPVKTTTLMAPCWNWLQPPNPPSDGMSNLQIVNTRKEVQKRKFEPNKPTAKKLDPLFECIHNHQRVKFKIIVKKGFLLNFVLNTTFISSFSTTDLSVFI